MNREIKLRAFYENKMHNVYAIKWRSDGACVLLGDEFQNITVRFSECVLMQRTGINDCKGTPIYEGDIIKWQHKKYDKEPRTGILKYQSHRCAYCIEYDGIGKYISSIDTAINSIEVIGNKYENPELLS